MFFNRARGRVYIYIPTWARWMLSVYMYRLIGEYHLIYIVGTRWTNGTLSDDH